jgi:hypothetical protein
MKSLDEQTTGWKGLFRPSGDSGASSGKLMLRIPKSLHGQLAQAAKTEGVSLNQYITMILAKAIGWSEAKSPTEDRKEGTMTRRAYGDRKRSYVVVPQPDGWIQLWVCHGNGSVRAMMKQHKDDPRYFLEHQSTYAKGYFRAYYWLNEVLNDYRPYFESGRVEIVMDADCESL